MKPLKQVAGAYMALSEGERQLQEHRYDEAAASCRRAMDLSWTIPSEEAFDHEGFDALCHAGLSAALSKTGNYPQSLESAEIALKYFNRRGELRGSEGLQWIVSVISRATAFEKSGRTAEALKGFQQAREMLIERGKLADSREQELLSDVEKQLRDSEAAHPPATTTKRGYKAWWEFWS
jgi:tetratricopeptide (TPR) repeat protein